MIGRLRGTLAAAGTAPAALRDARLGLAATLQDLGDSAAARSLLERVVADYETSVAADDLKLQTARIALARSLRGMQDSAGAQALLEQGLVADDPLESLVSVLADVRTTDDETSHVSVATDKLTTHGVIVGMTGSGKTGLGVIVIEEALRARASGK